MARVGCPAGGTFVTGIDNKGRLVGYYGPEIGLEGSLGAITPVHGFLAALTQQLLDQTRKSASAKRQCNRDRVARCIRRLRRWGVPSDLKSALCCCAQLPDEIRGA
jgi:hypothetical protein